MVCVQNLRLLKNQKLKAKNEIVLIPHVHCNTVNDRKDITKSRANPFTNIDLTEGMTDHWSYAHNLSSC